MYHLSCSGGQQNRRGCSYNVAHLIHLSLIYLCSPLWLQRVPRCQMSAESIRIKYITAVSICQGIGREYLLLQYIMHDEYLPPL